MKRGRKIGWSLAAMVVLGIMVSILVVIGKGCGPAYDRYYGFETYAELRELFGEDLQFPTYYPDGFDPRNIKENTATWNAVSVYEDKRKSIPKSKYYEWVGLSIVKDYTNSEIDNVSVSKIHIMLGFPDKINRTRTNIDDALVHEGQKYYISIGNDAKNKIITIRAEVASEDIGLFEIIFLLPTTRALSEAEFNEIKEPLKEKYLAEAFKMHESMEIW